MRWRGWGFVVFAAGRAVPFLLIAAETLRRSTPPDDLRRVGKRLVAAVARVEPPLLVGVAVAVLATG